jgi:hypothetical protein
MKTTEKRHLEALLDLLDANGRAEALRALEAILTRQATDRAA